MSILFAVPRYHYASYADLYELIRLSEFQTCYIDEIDQSSDNDYIITIYNGEFGDYSGSRAKIHLLDLEYHVGENALPPLPNVEIWAADKWVAKQIGAKYVPMGSHPKLYMPLAQGGYAVGAHQETFDVAYIGFISGLQRREVIRQQLIERGVKVSPTVAWHWDRCALLRASKVYLHVHQHAHIPAVPPLRMVVAAAYSLPVISETCADVGIFNGYVTRMEYDRLAETIQRLFQGEMWQRLLGEVTETGERLHQLLCVDCTFRKSVEGAL